MSSSSSSDDSDGWDDIEVVVGRDDHQSAATADALVSSASAGDRGVNRALLLLTSSTGEEAIFKQSGGAGAGAAASKKTTEVTSAAALYAGMPGATRTRSCAFVGAHLHGKSRLVQSLVGRRNRLVPTAGYDRQRCLTTALYCQSGVLCGVNASSHANRAPVLFTAADVPGHPNFSAELPPAILVSDCAALVVDAVDGVTASTESALDAVVAERLPLFLVVSKLDRLLVELRIPPADAYKKIKHIVDSVNVLLQARGAPLVNPVDGTVVLSSSKFHLALTLPIVARRYAERFGQQSVSAPWLATQLWGQITFDGATNKFSPIAPGVAAAAGASAAKPSFVAFVLEPLFKAMVAALRGTDAALQQQQNAASSKGGDNNNNNNNGNSSSSTSIVNLVKAQVAGVFGPFRENLPDAFLEAMDAAFFARHNNNNNNNNNSVDHPYVVSLLQGMFRMPEPAYSLLLSSNHLRGAEGALLRSELEHDEAYQRPFGVIAAKTRLEVDGGSASAAAAAATASKQQGRRKVARSFALLKLLSGTLQLRQPIAVYSGPDARIARLEPKMMLLVMAGSKVVPVQRIAAGATVLVDFAASSASGADDDAAAAAATTMADLVVPSLLIPRQSGGDGDDDDSFFSAAAAAERLPVAKRRDNLTTLFCKVAVEPTDIRDVATLRQVVESIAAERNGLAVAVEDTGDLVLSGQGEVQLDAVLFDIRRHCAVRVTPPFTAFAETVVAGGGSSNNNGGGGGVLRRHTEQQALTLSAFASPLGKETSAAVARGVFHGVHQSFGARAAVLNQMRAECGWDLVDCDTFVDVIGSGGGSGSAASAAAILFSDCKEHQTVASSSSRTTGTADIHRWVAFGASTAVRRGPLCDEPVRNVAFTLVDIIQQQRQQQQHVVIPQGTATACARTVVRKAFLGAAPRLLEPVMEAHITLPQARVNELTEMLRKRRGSVLQEVPIPATTWTVLRALLPLADSFGFETAVRVGTQGEAFPVLVFSEWALVPGDPLDASVRLSPHEPASGVALARDFVTKTRRRKGLPENIDLI